MSAELRVFEDPADPFLKWVEIDGDWFRLDEAALIESEEKTLMDFGRRLLDSDKFTRWAFRDR